MRTRYEFPALSVALCHDGSTIPRKVKLIFTRSWCWSTCIIVHASEEMVHAPCTLAEPHIHAYEEALCWLILDADSLLMLTHCWCWLILDADSLLSHVAWEYMCMFLANMHMWHVHWFWHHTVPVRLWMFSQGLLLAVVRFCFSHNRQCFIRLFTWSCYILVCTHATLLYIC